MRDLVAAHPQLLRAVAAYGLPGTVHTLPDRPLSEEDWRPFFTAVRHQRLVGLLHAAVRAGHFPVTDAQGEQVLRRHVQAMTSVLLLEQSLLATVDLLELAGVEVRVLKGSAVALLDYPEPSLRSFGDVDLLVRSAEFDAAVEALSSAGYRRRYPQPQPGFDRRFSKGASFFTPDGHELDLHRTFVMGPYGMTIRSEDLWRGSQAFQLAGRTLHALDPEGRVLHAAFHAALGNWPARLAPHRDLAEMLLFRRIDESQVRATAQTWQAEAVLARAVHGAWELLGLADVTGLSTWSARHQPTDRDVKFIDLYSNPQNNYAAKSFAAVRVVPGLRNKLGYLRALALPERSYLDQRHASFTARLRHGLRQSVMGGGHR